MDHYDAYIFDWDGTVAQTLTAWLAIVKKTLDEYGIEASDKEIVRAIFGRAEVGLTELGVPSADFPTIFETWDQAAAVRMPQVPLYEHIAEVFDELRQRGKKLAVVTATMRPTIEGMLQTHGLQDTFDIVVTGSDDFPDKPNPRGVQSVLARLGVPKDRALMLGDTEKDLGAAHNAGIDSLLFYPPQHDIVHTLAELQAHQPTYIIASWQELLRQFS